jgi:hypothetical protein
MLRTSVNIDGIVPNQPLIIFPFGEVLKAVASHDDRKFVVGIFFLQIGERVYGIGWFWEFELDVGGLEPGFTFYSQSHQVKAVIFIQEGGRPLEGVLRRDNKPYLIEMGMLKDKIGDNKMAVVNGVKGAKI